MAKRSDEQTIDQLRLIGAQMANLCFNLSQCAGEPLSQRNAEAMKDLQRQWDHWSAVAYGQQKLRAARPKRKADVKK